MPDFGPGPHLTVSAAEEEAKDISGRNLVRIIPVFRQLIIYFDNKFWDGMRTLDAACITLEYESGIGSLYLTFAEAYGKYTITNNNSSDTITVGEDLFIHEFVDLEKRFESAPTSVTLSFDSGPARLHELDVYSVGEVQASVQKWEHPADGKTDLLLFATHSDDDQLFFAGLLPYYAVERGYQVQVVYLTDHHHNAPHRVHEVRNGLWAVGVTAYPVFGPYEDFNDVSTKEEAFRKFAGYGCSQEQMTGFIVEQLRRFKPLVAVGHDLNGEYGHAQHQVFAQLLIDAVEISNDAAYYPETAEKYGVWDVPKTYLHLYSENPIVMDWDQPMEKFNGMTPYEVTKELGFPAHESQQWGWSWYFQGKSTAAEIKRYSPGEYGLYRTTVGVDTGKNDMFENLTNYAEQERLAEEARQASEAAAREEAVRQESIAQEEERRVAKEASERSKMIVWLIVDGFLLAALIVPLCIRGRRRR